ncbi:hypothetical protein [Thermoflexus sp.]|uniref:hypothetical protein n=1 Tax=Thermoflexus sp. TaxID=1969742 RepID=UPI0035E3FE11
MGWRSLRLGLLIGLGWGLACTPPGGAVPSAPGSPTRPAAPPASPSPTVSPSPSPTPRPAPSPTLAGPPTLLPFTPPPGFDPAVYPPPTPAAPNVQLTYAAACPNLSGTEMSPPPTPEEVLPLLHALASADAQRRQQATDPAFWPLLQGIRLEEAPGPEQLMPPRPAKESPYGELLGNGCGEAVMARTWWVEVCPGPCANPQAARMEALKRHVYVIRRQGHWLIWALR